MVDVDDHLEGDRQIGGGQSLVEGAALGDRVAEFAADRHGLPEDVFQAGGLALLGDIAPAFDDLVDQRLAAGRVVIVLLGEDRELRAHAVGAEIAGDIGERAEPFDVIVAHVLIGWPIWLRRA